MNTDFESFKKIFSNHNEKTIRIIFTELQTFDENKINNIFTELQTFDENKINKIFKNIKPLSINFDRKFYYSQIKDLDNVYTEDYELISKFNNNILITKYEYNAQSNNSFPNLNKYHHTENISQHIYKFDNLKIVVIIENNKIIIEFNNYNQDILNKVYNLINQLLE